MAFVKYYPGICLVSTMTINTRNLCLHYGQRFYPTICHGTTHVQLMYLSTYIILVRNMRADGKIKIGKVILVFNLPLRHEMHA